MFSSSPNIIRTISVHYIFIHRTKKSIFSCFRLKLIKKWTRVFLISRLNLLPRLSFQIFSALEYLHKNGLVNRCISPENIFLTKNVLTKFFPVSVYFLDCFMRFQGEIRLSQYGLYYLTENETLVSFSVGFVDLFFLIFDSRTFSEFISETRFISLPKLFRRRNVRKADRKLTFGPSVWYCWNW